MDINSQKSFTENFSFTVHKAAFELGPIRCPLAA